MVSNHHGLSELLHCSPTDDDAHAPSDLLRVPGLPARDRSRRYWDATRRLHSADTAHDGADDSALLVAAAACKTCLVDLESRLPGSIAAAAFEAHQVHRRATVDRSLDRLWRASTEFPLRTVLRAAPRRVDSRRVLSAPLVRTLSRSRIGQCVAPQTLWRTILFLSGCETPVSSDGGVDSRLSPLRTHCD